jgi:hypothetical protein
VLSLLGFPLLAGGIIWLLLPRPCDPSLLVGGRKLDFKAAMQSLKLNVSASPAAQDVIKENLQFFLARSEQLCRSQREGTIPNAEYESRNDQIATWYMQLLTNAQQGKLRAVQPGQKDALNAAVSQLPISNAPEKLAEVNLQDTDGRLIPSGATLRNDDRFAINLNVSNSSFVYVVSQGTSGKISRIFPSVFSSKGNPVKGPVRIPEDLSRFIKVAGAPGVEKLYVFVGHERDTELEKIPQIGTQDKNEDETRQKFAERIVTRDFFVTASNSTPAARSKPIDMKSVYGQASSELEFDHAP